MASVSFPASITTTTSSTTVTVASPRTVTCESMAEPLEWDTQTVTKSCGIRGRLLGIFSVSPLIVYTIGG